LNIEVPIIIKKFDYHKEIKDKLLTIIDNHESVYFNNDWEKVKTDYYTDKREYANFLLPKINIFLENIFINELNFKTYMKNEMISFFWFQQYNELDTHNWHIHERSMYNLIYYVEKSDDSPSTELKSPISDKIFSPDVNEGDILLFPSFLIHRSAPNQSDKRKTIIAFNVY